MPAFLFQDMRWEAPGSCESRFPQSRILAFQRFIELKNSSLDLVFFILSDKAGRCRTHLGVQPSLGICDISM